MPKAFNEIILSEGGYALEFSNVGRLPKGNPNPINYEGKECICKSEERYIDKNGQEAYRPTGCKNVTKSIFGVCKDHKKAKFRPLHSVDWIGRIIPPGYTREDCLTDAPAHWYITEMLVKWMGTDKLHMNTMDKFIADLLDGNELGIVAKIPDATTLEFNLENGINGEESPLGVVKKIKELIDMHFPKEKFGEITLDGGMYHSKSLKNVPIRIIAGLLAVASACEESNRGDAWFYAKHKEYLSKKKPRQASAYMSSVYYFLRRYTKATEAQARMSLKG